MTVRTIDVEALKLPEVPVIAIVAAPVVAVLLAVRVRTLEPVVGLVAKLALTPLGKLLAASVTLPANPFAPVTAIVSVTLLPSMTDRIDAVGATVKLGAALTAKLCCTCGAAEKEAFPA